MKRKEELVKKAEEGESIDYSGIDLDGVDLSEADGKQGIPSCILLTITKTKTDMLDEVSGRAKRDERNVSDYSSTLHTHLQSRR